MLGWAWHRLVWADYVPGWTRSWLGMAWESYLLEWALHGLGWACSALDVGLA